MLRMGFVKCKRHGDTIGFMVSRKIDDVIRNESRRIKKNDLHLVRIFLEGSPVDYTFWIEKVDLRKMGVEIKDRYEFEVEGEKMIGDNVPVCQKCFEEILDG
jgi:hypothetical protein